MFDYLILFIIDVSAALQNMPYAIGESSERKALTCKGMGILS